MYLSRILQHQEIIVEGNLIEGCGGCGQSKREARTAFVVPSEIRRSVEKECRVTGGDKP